MKTRLFLAKNGIQRQLMTSVEGRTSLTANPVSTTEQHFLFILNQSPLWRFYTQVVVGIAKQVTLHVIWPVHEDMKINFEPIQFSMTQYMPVSHFNSWWTGTAIYIYFLCLWKGKEKAGPVSLLNTDLQTNDSLTNNGAVMVSFNFALGEGKVSVNL